MEDCFKVSVRSLTVDKYRKPQSDISSSLCTQIRTPMNWNHITYIPTAIIISNPQPNYEWVSPIKRSPYWTQRCHFIGQPSLKTHNKQDGNQPWMPCSLFINRIKKSWRHQQQHKFHWAQLCFITVLLSTQIIMYMPQYV
jgi:hypothetical protein